ncbi:hypothetical protein MERGE_000289 [Pneumocystis wakefieldiae]|uniref:DNA helicase n=1 Tax=Pneumocystis wakefieldiae TaxID=38082 RepID=A0A899FUY2_9ASCO|nr:hypothetical protein MERGE_000289 [Pneumocystis wakefieldiae]
MTIFKNKKRCIGLTDEAEEPLNNEERETIQVPCSSPISFSSFLSENQTRNKNIDNLLSNTEESKDLIQRTNLIPKKSENEYATVNAVQPSYSLSLENNFNTIYQEKSEDTTFVIKESPIGRFKEYASQFAYQPKENTNIETNEMIQKSNIDDYSNSLSNRYLMQKAAQTRDNREKIIGSNTFKKKIDFLRRIYPHLPEYVLENMILKPSPDLNNMTELVNLENVDITNLRSSPIGVQEKISSKRTLQHSRYTIREKHINSTQNQNYITHVNNANKFVQKKRLIKGISRIRNQKDSFSESDDSSVSNEDINDNSQLEEETLKFLNQKSAKEIADLANCSLEIAEEIIQSRPFKNIDSIKEIRSMKVLESCMEMLEGYKAIDSLISKCDELGKSISRSISNWGLKITPEIGELSIGSDDIDNIQINDQGYINQQPNLISDAVKLKRYQLFGVNWLNLLYRKKLSGILADEMGLGKTCQIIAFFAHLLESGRTGPHLIVVPASILENWLRELARFCPALKVEPYYGTQNERLDIRYHLEENPDYNIIITTYQLATGSKEDRSFLKRQRFDVCVYDEGHFLKNSLSERYKHLMNINANFRLLLTGTPLQNNLKELISLLFFILPTLFSENIEKLITVFKIKTINDGNSGSTLLSEQRIMRAKSMMTPFVLRRKKIHVLNDLPKKIQHIEFCEMNKEQQSIYDECIFTQKKSVEERNGGIEPKNDKKRTFNVLMQLRKATNHPLLFRRIYNDVILKKIAKNIMKEPDYKNANQTYIYEDMEVMTDFEIHQLCKKFPSIQSFALKGTPWMNSGKVEKLKCLLIEAKERGNKVLLFSQFVETLNILEEVLETLNIAFTRLDGRTSVDTRQDIIDQFTDESDITVFLLSTKAGGFGINLSCANVVILYDGSFNPHDDKQAEDRAHRVGQTKEVHVIRLVTKNTIEEYIQSLANTKLALDSSISGLDDEQLELKAEIYLKNLIESPSYQDFSLKT